jgi:hypothetical protein
VRYNSSPSPPPCKLDDEEGDDSLCVIPTHSSTCSSSPSEALGTTLKGEVCTDCCKLCATPWGFINNGVTCFQQRAEVLLAAVVVADGSRPSCYHRR